MPRRMKESDASNVAELSVKLATSLKKSDKEASDDKARAIVWESANAPVEKPLPSALGGIVETTWIDTEHLVSTVQRLRESLALHDKRSEHGSLVKANDLAESNRHEAFRAYLTARLELEQWERDNEVIFASLRIEATRAMQREKDLGYRAKAITEADTIAKMAELFPDEWRAQELRRSKATLAVSALEDLFKSWESRCRTLNAMLSKAR